MGGLPGSSVYPVARLEAAAKYRRLRIQRQQPVANAAIFSFWRGTHQNKGIGARQSAERLPQLAQRKDGASPEWIQSVNQHDVQVTRQLPVLETIVEQEQIRLILLFEQPAGGPAVGAYPSVGVAGMDEDLRFIAGYAGRSIHAGFDQNTGLDGPAHVSARQDGGTMPA